MPTKTKATTTTPKQELIEFEMTAVIPVAQYANVQPVIKGYGKTWEEARDDALAKSQGIWAMVGEGGKSLEVRKTGAPTVSNIERETLKCWASGTELYYDDVSHTYIDSEGNEYLSGSKFAHQFSHEFNKAAILPKYAEKNGLKEYQVDEYWGAKNKCSTTWGTAIHQAMETYGEHKAVADKLGKEVGVHPLVLPIVEDFFENSPGTRLFERFVAHKETKRCGRIDSLLIHEDGTITIEDFKTNADIYKSSDKPKYLKAPYNFLTNSSISEYTLQLNFYRAIIEASGKKVRGMKLHWLDPDGEWVTIDVKEVDIDAPQSKIDLSIVK